MRVNEAMPAVHLANQERSKQWFGEHEGTFSCAKSNFYGKAFGVYLM
jgi:hypothetical protein